MSDSNPTSVQRSSLRPALRRALWHIRWAAGLALVALATMVDGLATRVDPYADDEGVGG